MNDVFKPASRYNAFTRMSLLKLNEPLQKLITNQSNLF